jgi:hypothetical protein
MRPAPSTCAEVLDRAVYPVAPAVGLPGIDRIVVRRPRTEALDAHAKNRIGMGLIQAAVCLRCVARFNGILAVMYDSEMLVPAQGEQYGRFPINYPGNNLKFIRRHRNAR